MGFNIIKQEDITNVSKTLIEIIEEKEKNQLKDMKEYLSKTQLSAEERLKEYSNFSTKLFETKINAGISKAYDYIVKDIELSQKNEINIAQIGLTNSQKLQVEAEVDLSEVKARVYEQDILKAKEETDLTTARVAQVEAEVDLSEVKARVYEQDILKAKEETDLTTARTAQVEIETEAVTSNILVSLTDLQTKSDNTVANTLSEARRNGASVTKTPKTWIDPVTNQTISYDHISLAAAAAGDTEKGLIGTQMDLALKQASTFDHHTKLQVASQIGQRVDEMLASDMTNVTGLLKSQKNIYESMFPGEPALFTSTYANNPV